MHDIVARKNSWVLHDSVTIEERGSSQINILCCHVNLINAKCLGGPIILVDIELISMIQFRWNKF